MELALHCMGLARVVVGQRGWFRLRENLYLFFRPRIQRARNENVGGLSIPQAANQRFKLTAWARAARPSALGLTASAAT